MCLLFGVFVFVFLFIFQPFGLNSLNSGKLAVTLGYGLTTFLFMIFLNMVLYPLLPWFFDEEKWTVGRELFWSIVNIAAIGLANALYSTFIGIVPLSLSTIFWFEIYTLLVGVFPVLISILFSEALLKKKYEIASLQMNAELKEVAAPGVEQAAASTVNIPSENANENFSVELKDLLYIRSSDNYVEIYHTGGNAISKKLLRNSLKSVAETLEQNTKLFRCHKSYLVNLDKVQHVSGNAQGYKLHLFNTEVLIPVSRQYNKEIKERLSVHP